MSTPARPAANVSPSLGTLLLFAAIICLAVALLIDVSAFSGNEPAWRDGGLLAFVASFVVR